MSGALTLLCLSGSYERIHYGFVLATGAAAMGRPVLLFATNAALHGVCRDWSGLRNRDRDRTAIARGVAGLDELRDVAIELGVRMMACEAGLRMEGLAASDLLDGVEIGGVATLLSDTRGAIITL